MLICPNCGAEASKVIAFGLPMKFCLKDTCHTLWGFWSLPYTFLIAPVEGFFSNGFYFMTYQGDYLTALYDWLFGERE